MSIDKSKIKKFIGISAVAIGVAFIGMSILAKKKKSSSTYENDKDQQNPFEGKKVVLVEDENEIPITVLVSTRSTSKEPLM